jgi:hypothetical protein
VLMPSLTSRFTMMVLLAFCGELLAQNPQVKTRAGSRFPTVIFTSVLWSADPSYYSIAVDSIGTATYQSAPESLERTGVPYTIESAIGPGGQQLTSRAGSIFSVAKCRSNNFPLRKTGFIHSSTMTCSSALNSRIAGRPIRTSRSSHQFLKKFLRLWSMDGGWHIFNSMTGRPLRLNLGDCRRTQTGMCCGNGRLLLQS